MREIAVINLASDTLISIYEFSSLVNLERDTGPLEVHGITNEMVADAEPSVSSPDLRIMLRVSKITCTKTATKTSVSALEQVCC